MQEIPSEQDTLHSRGSVNIDQIPERAVIFMGGIGYDEQRNREVGGAIMRLGNYSHTITIPDSVPAGPRDGTIIHRYPDGSELEKPGKESLTQLGNDEAEIRFSKLHADRARLLIAAIEADGGQPVDAVFQSGDASTGLLAIHERPELFERVVLLDPAGIIDLPPRREFLKQELRSGNLSQIFRRKQKVTESERFEVPAGRFQKMRRIRRSSQGGNQIATYVSSQAGMLHEIAESEHAPSLSIIASQFDHAYSPLRILQSLVSLDDIRSFFVTNMGHGLGGKQKRLEQVIQVLKQTEEVAESFVDRLHFFDGVSETYSEKMMKIVHERLRK